MSEQAEQGELWPTKQVPEHDPSEEAIDRGTPQTPRPEQHIPTYEKRYDALFDYFTDVRHMDSATARAAVIAELGPDPDEEVTDAASGEDASAEDVEEKNRLTGKLGVEADIDFIARKMADGLSFVEANALMLARREHNKRDY